MTARLRRRAARLALPLLLPLLLLLPAANPAGARVNDSVIAEDSNFARMNGFYLRQGIERGEIGGDGVHDRTAVNYRVAYGVLHNFEVGADLPYLVFTGQHAGLGDIRVYQKYKFSEENASAPALAGGLALYAPTGDEDRGLGTGKAAVELYGVALRTFDRFTVNLHLAYRIQTNNDYDNVLRYDVAVKTPIEQLGHNLTGVLELNGAKGDWDEVYASPGLLWEPREDFSIGFAAQIGLTRDSYDYQTVLRLGHDF